MRHLTFSLVVASLGLSACIESGQSDAEGPPNTGPSLESMLKTQGCTVKKVKGVFTITCADGSQASSGAPSLHLKDLPNMLYLSNYGIIPIFKNQTNGHVLSYDQQGQLRKITRTYWDGANCAGRAYITPIDVIMQDQSFVADNSYPTPAQTLKVIGYGPLTIQSKFENGACTVWSATSSGMLQVEAADLDASDPLTITLPLEVVAE